MAKRALITGITGQDGSYLAELLLAKGYEVHGLVRRASTFGATSRIDHLHNWGRGTSGEERGTLELHYGDLADSGAVTRVLATVRPDEIYNLAAQSHVRVSFDLAEYTAEVTGVGTLRLLECMRNLGLSGQTRFYQASSSELYGQVRETPQNEMTPFHPRSPYACAKAFAHYATVNYRESYGLHASCGILFNHESPRRGENFVTRKITLGLARIASGLQETIALGNLDAQRDWGFAGDYVEAMWRMLQQDTPDDYVIATGETHSVREFLDEAAAVIGGGLDWTKHVVVDPRYYRPAEVDVLVGDASKARRILGWTPRVSFRELVRMMVEADLEGARSEERGAREGITNQS
ncbi:MAG TPA: GDP-mannose 4,6-dehydratase [Gemmatimonadaceae bacterium]|nr:GDP-mannose 4,6-dehydratase [Gemmatimonadaceae bacterium]